MTRRWAAVAALALAACPAPRTALRPPPVPLSAPGQHDEPALAGVVHVVSRGETIYRIARAYGIDPADLMETNGIVDPHTVAAGAELFVPGASRVVEVPPSPVPGDPSATPATKTATPSAIPVPTSPSTPTATPSQTANATAVTPRPATLGGPRGDPPLAWPLKGVLYGRYGVRDGRRHDGIDIAAPEGTVVVAAMAGTVLHVGEKAGYGWIVILKHEGGLVTLYAHNSRVLVQDGARVRRGEPIARVGQTGRTTGPHLHFEVREGTRPKNPLLFLP